MLKINAVSVSRIGWGAGRGNWHLFLNMVRGIQLQAHHHRGTFLLFRSVARGCHESGLHRTSEPQLRVKILVTSLLPWVLFVIVDVPAVVVVGRIEVTTFPDSPEVNYWKSNLFGANGT